MIPLSESARDWKEDFADENGMYEGRCVKCGGHFVGHKRRPLCKICGTPSEAFKKMVEALELAVRLEEIEIDNLKTDGWNETSAPVAACSLNLKKYKEALDAAKKEMP